MISYILGSRLRYLHLERIYDEDIQINLVVKGKSAKIHRTANVIVQASFKSNQARIVKPQKETLKVCLLSLVHLKEAGLMKKVGCLKFIALVLKYHGHQLL